MENAMDGMLKVGDKVVVNVDGNKILQTVTRIKDNIGWRDELKIGDKVLLNEDGRKTVRIVKYVGDKVIGLDNGLEYRKDDGREFRYECLKDVYNPVLLMDFYIKELFGKGKQI